MSDVLGRIVASLCVGMLTTAALFAMCVLVVLVWLFISPFVAVVAVVAVILVSVVAYLTLFDC